MVRAMLERWAALDEAVCVGSAATTADALTIVRETCGATAILSLQTDDDLGARGLRWPIVWSLAMRTGITAARVPIRDFDKRDLLGNLDAALAALDGLIAAGHRVYVHCSAGLNRSPSVCVAHFARAQGLEPAHAFVLARHPEAVPYLDVLAKWAKRAGYR
jgi:hypothetical protein